MFKLYNFCFVTSNISGSTLSAIATVGENGDITGSTLSANAAVGENGDITGSLAQYPQMLPLEKNGDITGSTLSANFLSHI
jgi:hypothetical protein